MDVKTGSQFLSLCEHQSAIQKVSFKSSALEPFSALLPLLPHEGTLYWSPGQDHYGLLELNGMASAIWMLHRDSLLMACDGITLEAVLQNSTMEKLWGSRGLPADRELLAKAEEAGAKEYARCTKKNNSAIESLRKQKGAQLLYLTDEAWSAFEPLQEFPKRITIPAPEDVLDYFATYRKLPSLPWE